MNNTFVHNNSLPSISTNLRVFIEPYGTDIYKKEKLLFEIKKAVYGINKISANTCGLVDIRYATYYNLFGIPKDKIQNIVSVIQLETPLFFVYYSVEDLLSNTEFMSRGLKKTHDDFLEDDIHFFDYIAMEALPDVLDKRAKSIMLCLDLLEIPYFNISSADILFLYTKTSNKETEDSFMVFEDFHYQKAVDSVRDVKKNRITNVEQNLDVKSDVYEITHFFHQNEKNKYSPIEDFVNFSYQKTKIFLSEQKLLMNLGDVCYLKHYFYLEKRNPTLLEIDILDALWDENNRQTTLLTHIHHVAFPNREDEAIVRAWNCYKDLRVELKNIDAAVSLEDVLTITTRYFAKKKVVGNTFLNNTKYIPIDTRTYAKDATKNEQDFFVFNHTIRVDDLVSNSTGIDDLITQLECDVSSTHFCCTQQNMTTQNNFEIFSANTHSFTKQCHRIDKDLLGLEVLCTTGIVSCYGDVNNGIEADDLVVLIGMGVLSENTFRSHMVKKKLEVFFKTVYKLGCVKKTFSLENEGIVTAASKIIEDFSLGLEIDLDIFLSSFYKIENKSKLSKTDILFTKSQNYVMSVIAFKDFNVLNEYAKKQSLQLITLGQITKNTNVIIYKNNKIAANLSKNILTSKGRAQKTHVRIKTSSHVYAMSPPWYKSFSNVTNEFWKSLENDMINFRHCVNDFCNVCDDTVRGRAVLLSKGGMYQTGKEEGSAVFFPADENLFRNKDSVCVSAVRDCSFVFDQTSFHGALYTIVDVLTKIVCMGANPFSAGISNYWILPKGMDKKHSDQTFFGDFLAASLGVMDVQLSLKIPSMNNKTIYKANTLQKIQFISSVSNVCDILSVKSTQITEAGLRIYIFNSVPKADGSPNYTTLINMWNWMEKYNSVIKNAQSIGNTGFLTVLGNMCYGNKMGCEITFYADFLYTPGYGSIIITSKHKIIPPHNVDCVFVGITTSSHTLTCKVVEHGVKTYSLQDFNKGKTHFYAEALKIFLEKKAEVKNATKIIHSSLLPLPNITTNKGRVKICIPSFFNTSGLDDMIYACTRLKANCVVSNFFTDNTQAIKSSIEHLEQNIYSSKMLILGDNTMDGFWKNITFNGYEMFLSAVLQDKRIILAISQLLHNDGLVLGIGSGFRALVKSSWLPFNNPYDNLQNDTFRTHKEDIPFFVNKTMSKALMCTEVTNTKLSPWLSLCEADVRYWNFFMYNTGELVVSKKILALLEKNKRIVSRYKENDIKYIEGLIAANGHILGKLGHIEQYQIGSYKNFPAYLNQPILNAGIQYFL